MVVRRGHDVSQRSHVVGLALEPVNRFCRDEVRVGPPWDRRTQNVLCLPGQKPVSRT